MERGRVVSVDRMIDQLWLGEPPPRAIASLQAYVSNLRRILEPGRARRAQARILVSAPPGYAVRLPDEAVDAWRFESLLTAARKDAPGQPERARQELEQALALWRGPAYAEFADEEWATAEVVRLTEQHLAAQEAWAEVALRTGAAELGSIGHEHGLPEYEWYAEYIAGTAAAVLGQPGELRRRLDSGRRLADEYRMAEPQAVQLCSEAMLAYVEGRFDDACRHYAEATGQMRRNGSLHADGFHRLARLTIELSQGHTAQAEPLARALHEMTGPLAADAWAVTLAAAGRAGEARRLHQEAAAMPLRPDYFYTIFATIRAMAAIAVGDRAAAGALVTDLTPLAGLLAGAASAALAMQPVAQTLGELSAFLGRPQEAARHFAAAQQVARRWNSPHWAARAARSR